MKTENGRQRSKVTALLFDFGGTLAFLDFDLLATEFSRPGRKLDALKLEHAEYAGRAALDHHLMSEKSRDPMPHTKISSARG